VKPDQRSADKTIKVLFIAGSGRTGSTLLGSILGQVDGFFSVGELSNIWERGMIEGRKCGCGLPFSECPVWSGVVTEAFGTPPAVDPYRISAARHRWRRGFGVPRFLLWRRRSHDSLDEHQQALKALYQAVQSRTHCRVIVDSSKSPIHGAVLESIPGLEVFVVHLVRDPRATAYSWRRQKRLPDFGDDRLMQQQTPVTSARRWVKWQLVTELIWGRRDPHYMLLRYEDLVSNPKEALERILSHVEEPSAALPLMEGKSIELSTTHSVSGNPDRFTSGPVKLRDDNKWIHAMRKRDRVQVNAITLPLLHRYDYRWRHKALLNVGGEGSS
jgi:hypothetical protein